MSSDTLSIGSTYLFVGGLICFKTKPPCGIFLRLVAPPCFGRIHHSAGVHQERDRSEAQIPGMDVWQTCIARHVLGSQKTPWLIHVFLFHCDDHFSPGVHFFKIPESFGSFTQRVAAIDDRDDLARLQQLFKKGHVHLVKSCRQASKFPTPG